MAWMVQPASAGVSVGGPSVELRRGRESGGSEARPSCLLTQGERPSQEQKRKRNRNTAAVEHLELTRCVDDRDLFQELGRTLAAFEPGQETGPKVGEGLHDDKTQTRMSTMPLPMR